ncbi:MAG: AsmA family protein, partial [Bdellovibrionales bacterium]
MRIVFGIVSVLVLLIAGLLVAPSFIDWSKYKEQGQQQIKALTGYDVRIGGDFSLAFLPTPHVNAAQVQVINPAVSQDPLARFDDLSVSVALGPLLTGAVQVSDISLTKPVFDIRLDKDGKGNWLSPEIEKLITKPEGQAEEAAPKKSAQVMFDQIHIEDGQFRFYDAAKNQEQRVEKINLALSADSLQGPFTAKGDAVYNGQQITFDGKTGAIDAAAQSVSLNLDAAQGPYAISYKGVVGTAQPFDAQGETVVKIASPEDLFPAAKDAGIDRVEIKGLVSANEQAVAFKDAVLQLGDQRYTGELAAQLKPSMAVSANLTGEDILNLDAFLPQSGGAQQSSGDLAALTQVLPKTVTLPQAFEVDIRVKTAGVIVNKALFKGVEIAAVKNAKAFGLSADIADIPGKGPARFKADLAFADKSASANGAEVYSGPVLTASLQANTQNTGETLKALSGQSGIPVLSDAKIGKFDFNVEAVPGRITLKNSVVNLDNLKASLSGSLTPQESGRALVSVAAVVDALDFDSLGGGQKPAAAGGDPLAGLKSLALPFDADFDVSINSAVLNGQNVTGLKAKGGLRPNMLSLASVSAGNFAGAAFDVSGKIGDLKTLSGIDADINVNAPDPYKSAAALKVDSSAWPKNLGAIKANVKASGSTTAMDVKTAVNVFGGTISVDGQVSNPLTALAFDNMGVRFQHPNMANAAKAFGAELPAYASLSKPIDFSTKLKTDGKVTTLSGIQAKLAGTDMSGTLRFDGSAAVPSISGALTFGRLELVSASKPTSQGGAGASSGGGKWSSAPLETGFLRAMNAGFDVSASSILYENWDMSAPSLKVSLQGGVLDIK